MPNLALPKISQPAIRALNHAGITHLEQLTNKRKEEILNLHGMGKKGIEILEIAMKENRISFLEN